MPPITLDEILQHHLSERGDKIALIEGDETCSYAGLEGRASRIAQGLLERGVRPGDRVAYLGKNTLAYIEYFLGAAKARAVTVPVNWRLATAEVGYILDNAHPKLLLVEQEFEQTAAAVASHTPRLVTGASGDTFKAWRERQSSARVTPRADWSEPLLQLYTSGTTGRPKGAVLTHRSLFSLRTHPEALPDWYQWSPDDVSMIAMPIAHISGTGWALWTLFHGATGVIMREFDPNVVFEKMLSKRVNKIMMVPTAMQIAARHPLAQRADFGFLKYIFYGGAPLPIELMRECSRVFGCGFVQMYGMTETAGTVVALGPDDHDLAKGDRLSSVGRAVPGVELRIVDSNGRVLEPGVIGEIAVRSEANMAEYFEMPQATADTIDAEGFLRTGDAGYLDPQGYLYLKDRVKDMIISGGENIYPAEVENAIYGHPAVAEVAVVGVPDEKWGESVRAYIVPQAGASPTLQDIVEWAGKRIARYKLPKSIELVGALPRNHTGKVLRRELRAGQRAG
jgi:acyl-CoA synthetase (AMP-forming)/AMP-acid ligase II